jgi:OOP family OmpA-OmpF porin
VGFLYRRRVGIEATYGKVMADSRLQPERNFPADRWGVDLTWTVLPDGKIRPFLAAGWGQLDIDAPANEKIRLNGVEFGGGLGLNLLETADVDADLRVGFRNLIAKNDAPLLDGTGDSKSHLLVTAEIQLRLPGAFGDDDEDGVTDRYDRCPHTQWGMPVDAQGCDLDSDGDGVSDGRDRCPDTPSGVPVDDRGCPRR